jgi:hypothetical protein
MITVASHRDLRANRRPETRGQTHGTSGQAGRVQGSTALQSRKHGTTDSSPARAIRSRNSATEFAKCWERRKDLTPCCRRLEHSVPFPMT